MSLDEEGVAKDVCTKSALDAAVYGASFVAMYVAARFPSHWYIHGHETASWYDKVRAVCLPSITEALAAMGVWLP